MKALNLFIIVMGMILAGSVQAQVTVSVNIGSPPPWGPAGYAEVHYYYLPDVEAYYDVQASMFIYFEGGTWVHRSYLPTRYRDYDLYGGYKVVMTDDHGNEPYRQFNEHRSKFARGYHGKAQKTIGERPGKGNSGAKNSNKGNHENKNGDNGKNISHNNDRGNSHGNDKNMRNDHSHGGGNDKKR